MAIIEKCSETIQSVVSYLVANPLLIAALLGVYVLLFLLSIALSGKKSGKNPFTEDAREVICELEVDQSARDRVLKQGFTSKKIPETLDAIVIGSGIGGLSTAAFLAKAGKKVLVLEQHDQSGGCCHTYIEKGFEFDVGIHYIGNMYEGSMTHTLMSQITAGQLQWVRLNDIYDKVVIGSGDSRREFPIPGTGDQAYRDALVSWFPDEEANIDRYLKLMDKVSSQFMGNMYLKILPRWLSTILLKTGLIHLVTGHFKYASKTVTEVLDSFTDNDDLKTVLAYNFGDYGTVPAEAPFSMHVALTKHFMRGGWYPRGGASEIAYHIIPTIEKAGGKVLVRAPVSQILTSESGRVEGVRVSKTSGDVDLYAPLVISAAGVINTYKTLLPKQITQKSAISRLLSSERLQSGVGGLSVFVGLDASTEELQVEPQNIWAFTEPDLDGCFRSYASLSADEACEKDVPLMFVSFPSSKDPTWPQRYPGKTTLAIITLSPWRWFSEWKDERVMHRGERYDDIKNKIGERMWRQVCAIYPQIADKRVYMEVGSPVTNQYYIAAPEGEFYGLDHTVKRFGSAECSMALRPETDIPGLWLAGQDVASCGFTGALFGGVLCASTILNRNLIHDVLALRKRIRQTKTDKNGVQNGVEKKKEE